MERVDHRKIRTVNASLTLRALYGGEPMTVEQIRVATGISRRTTEMILEELLGHEWAIEVAPKHLDDRPRGRPARRYAFNQLSGSVVAVRLDTDVISVTVADLRGQPLAEHSVETTTLMSRQDRLAVLHQAVRDALALGSQSYETVLAVSVSTLGIVRDDSTVDLPITLPEWSRFSIARELESVFSCTVHVENDAKLAALGERKAGAAQDIDNFVLLRVDGDRIGLGIVINGELYRGYDGAAGEVVWARVLGFGLVRKHLLGALASRHDPRHEQALELVAAGHRGEPEAILEIQELAHQLAPGLAAIAWTLAPELIIVDASIAEVADIVLPIFEAELATAGVAPVSRFTVSKIGTSTAIVQGALSKCLDIVHQLLFSGLELEAAPATPSDAK